MMRHLRSPVPLGLSPGGGGQLPGPLRSAAGLPGAYAQAAPRQVAQVAKKLVMPAPFPDNKPKRAHDITWALYAGKTGQPALEDVEQGVVGNCPLASLLAALAHTKVGSDHILNMVTESPGVVETDLSGVTDKLETDPDKPGVTRITSNRYFTVKLAAKQLIPAGKPANGTPAFLDVDVSSVLYTDDSDRDWGLLYMTSPTKSLWPCVIEKALAAKLGGYTELDYRYAKPGTRSSGFFWEVVLNAPPNVLPVTASTSSAAIQNIAKAAKTKPAISASKDGATQVTGDHGFAVLGMRGTMIELYDPNTTKQQTLSLGEFRNNFEMMLSMP
jgi:hypothetical protein